MKLVARRHCRQAGGGHDEPIASPQPEEARAAHDADNTAGALPKESVETMTATARGPAPRTATTPTTTHRDPAEGVAAIGVAEERRDWVVVFDLSTLSLRRSADGKTVTVSASGGEVLGSAKVGRAGADAAAVEAFHAIQRDSVLLRRDGDVVRECRIALYNPYTGAAACSAIAQGRVLLATGAGYPVEMTGTVAQLTGPEGDATLEVTGRVVARERVVDARLAARFLADHA